MLKGRWKRKSETLCDLEGKKTRYKVIGMEIDDKFRDKGTREKGDGWI